MRTLLLLALSSAVDCLECGNYPTVDRDELLPPIRIVYNSSDSQMRDFVCLLGRLGNVSGIYETKAQHHCVQLLTLPAEPWELHVMMLRADVSSALCEPRVYGPLPRVLQIRFALTTEDSFGPTNVVSLQLNSRGGHMMFDLDLDTEQRLVSLALKNLLRIVEQPRRRRRNESKMEKEVPIAMGTFKFESFQRVGEMTASPAMTKEVEEARRTQEMAGQWPWSNVAALLTLPLFLYASAVAFYLLWEMRTSPETIQQSQNEKSSQETEPLLKSSR